MSSKPTIICVPGAWHAPTHYDLVIKQLSSAGYETRAVALDSVGAAEPLKDFNPDVERIRAAIKQTIDTGNDAMIVMHSYGSMPAIEAVRGFEKKGSAPGVSHMFFCAAFVPPAGASLMDMLGGNPLPWFIINEDQTIVRPEDPGKVFYADCSDEVAKNAIAALKPFSYKTFSSPSQNQSWKEIPCTYMFCEDDQAIPVGAQQGMVQGSGVNFRTVTLKTSHSPFLSKPSEMAEEVRRSAGESI